MKIKRVKVLPVHALNRAVGALSARVGNLVNTKKKEQSIVLEILNDYCSSSTLHGVSYLGAEDKSRVEKIWWLIMFVLSVSACSYLITVTWIKWNENPVILSFEKEQIPVWDIPFPAITVCAVNKISQQSYNYTHYYRNRDNLTEEENRKMLEEIMTLSQVDIFFKESQFLALRRSELYGQTDFLANCGGLLGLFMGFSILSLLEIVYFLTIRLWFKYKVRRQKKN